MDCITLSTGTSRASNHRAFTAASPEAQPISAARGATTNTIDSVIMESFHTPNTARYREHPPASSASLQPPSLAPATAKRPTSTTQGTAPQPKVLNMARYSEHAPASAASFQPPSRAPIPARSPMITIQGTGPQPKESPPEISNCSLRSRGYSSQPDTVRVTSLRLNRPSSSSSLR